MKIQTLFISILLANLIAGSATAQIRLEGYNQQDIDQRLFSGRWAAHWITVPDEPENRFGVYHFRKTFSLDGEPERFIVHASADNRYKLYVNGRLASLGPAAGDVYNWNFESVDIAPLLKVGDNVIAAIVWNFAENRPLAHTSFGKTGFILQGNTTDQDVVNTGESWLCAKSKAYSPYQKPVLGYYAAGAGERMDAAEYLWGWKNPDYDDSKWASAKNIIQGAMKGAMDYPGWQLVPRPIPPMEMKPVRIAEARSAKGVELPAGFPAKTAAFSIPANSQAEILFDSGKLMTGYLTFAFSKGSGAEVEIEYAEAMYENPPHHNKGNRNEIEGKHFVGYGDKVIADGGWKREYTTLWWRSWRYIKLTVTTTDEPLIIDDIYATSSMYPFENVTTFNAPGHEYLNEILNVGWWTARLCAHETYMDCPYYEQLQYFGDARIQAMVSMFNTRDDRLVKNVLEQGRQSMVPDGITMSRYPSSLHQFIPSYSLVWICMGHDYWMYRGDKEYLRSLLPSFRSILSWYEQYLKSDYSLARIPLWYFGDWSEGLSNGEPVREADGNSAFQDILYVMSLDAAAQMEEAFGSKDNARHYREISDEIKKTLKPKYWNEARGLLADTHDHRSFSQHANVMAIIIGAFEGDQATELFDRLMADKSIIQCTIFFRYYLQIAMRMAGRGDTLLDNLDIWKEQLSLGLTTWAEMPEPSRSDCHAWGASHNIEFFRMILGIDTAAPGFAKVRIEPSLGPLKEVSGSMPHPLGTISVKYTVSKKGKLSAEISIPDGMTGVFVWKGKKYPLKSGRQVISEK